MIIRNFHDAQRVDVGGKAMGLFRLQQTKLNVPEFIVLNASTFVGLNEEQKKESGFQLSAEDKSLLMTILETWDFPNQAVVVRSSIADEDGQQHSFAGLMDSFLNLKTFDEVSEAIGCCAQSAFSERSKAYRKQKDLKASPKPAVIVQKQVEATCSGVLFTTSPDFPQEIAIHAVHGFSEYLNKGEDVPDEFYLWKKEGILNRKIVQRKEHAYISHSHKGLIKKELIGTRQDTDTLHENQLKELYKASNVIEKHFSFPCDVEFVFRDQTLFIVQARLVTQPIPEVIVYDNSNIQESYCGVTTPLTFSFACRAYATVYRQTMKTLALPNTVIQNQEIVIQNLLGLVKGRIYYNINNWYRGLQLLPSFNQNKADMERMMGLTEPVEFVEDRVKGFWEKCLLLPQLLVNLSRLLLAFRKLDKDIEIFLQNCQHYYGRFYQHDLSSLNMEELFDEKEKLDTNLLHQWTIPIVNDFYVMMNNGMANRNLKKSGIGNTDEFLSQYLSGNRKLASMLPALQLQYLAQETTKHEGLPSLVLELPLEINTIVKNHYPTFYDKTLDYIATYGDRTIGELKLETETMRVNPILFYKYLRNFVSSSSGLETNSKLHDQASAELVEKLSSQNFFLRRRVLSNLKNLQCAIANREAMRLERTRLFGMYRSLYLEIGNRFESIGILTNAHDIFYLTEEEIIGYKQRDQSVYRTMVLERKNSFSLFRKDDVPSRVIIPYPPVMVTAESEVEGLLTGTGCYPGIVEGEVLVITNQSEDIQVAGKIICAIRTDPGWAALFPSCKGVLIEKGSSLSHSVILLRELGIPTIINIPNLTKRLKTGQQIHINSSEGKIHILDHATH